MQQTLNIFGWEIIFLWATHPFLLKHNVSKAQLMSGVAAMFAIDGRWPLVEEDLWWKMIFSGRELLVEEDLRRKTPQVYPCQRRNCTHCLLCWMTVSYLLRENKWNSRKTTNMSSLDQIAIYGEWFRYTQHITRTRYTHQITRTRYTHQITWSRYKHQITRTRWTHHSTRTR